MTLLKLGDLVVVELVSEDSFGIKLVKSILLLALILKISLWIGNVRLKNPSKTANAWPNYSSVHCCTIDVFIRAGSVTNYSSKKKKKMLKILPAETLFFSFGELKYHVL